MKSIPFFSRPLKTYAISKQAYAPEIALAEFEGRSPLFFAPNRAVAGCSIVLGTPAWGVVALYVLSLVLRRDDTEPLFDAMRSVPMVVVIVLAISCVRNFVPLIRLFRATANVSPAGIGFDGKDLLYRSTDIVDVQRVMQRSHDGGTFETLEIELKRPQARSLLRRLVWSLMAPRRDRVVLCL